MTDRYSGFTVALDRDIRSDDARQVIDAILMIKGVLSVKPVVANAGTMIAEQRRDRDWELELLRLAREGAPRVKGGSG